MNPQSLADEKKPRVPWYLVVAALLVSAGMSYLILAEVIDWLKIPAMMNAMAQRSAANATENAVGEAEVDMSTFRVSLIAYRDRTGGFPTQEQGLEVLFNPPNPAPKHWKPPMKALKADPWGRAYQYQSPNPWTPDDANAYDLFSLGPDGVIGGGDDIR